MLILLIVLLIVFVEVIGQYCLKQYHLEKYTLWFVAGALVYAFIAYLLALSFNFEKIAIVHILWAGLSMIALTLFSYLMFNEKPSHKQLFGMALILIGVVLVY